MALRWPDDPIRQRRIRFGARAAIPAIALAGTAYAAETVFPQGPRDGLVLAGLFWAGAGAALLAWQLAPPVIRVEGADPAARLVDEESGLGNERYLREAVRRELARGTRHRSSASLVFIETRLIGFLPASEDDAPPTAGRFIAKVLARAMRQSDIAARVGARRFAVLLAETDATGAQAFVNRLADAFKRQPLPSGRGGTAIRVGIRAGFVPVAGEAERALAILEAAEGALDKATADRWLTAEA